MKLKLLSRDWWHYEAGLEEHGHRGKKVEVLDSNSTLFSLTRILVADNLLGHPLCSRAPLCEVRRLIAVHQVKSMYINSNSNFSSHYSVELFFTYDSWIGHPSKRIYFPKEYTK